MNQIINKYSTIELIEDLRKEITQLISNELLKGRESKDGSLSYRKLSTFLGRNIEYLSHLKHRMTDTHHIKYNPDFKFSKEDLAEFKDCLILKFRKRAQTCIKYLNEYEQLNSDLKDYKNQQYHIYNPCLKEDFFKIIDTKDKAYWLGFFYADGSVSDYCIRIELSKKDRIELIKFCEVIGLNPKDKVKDRSRLDNRTGSTYEMTYLGFGCLPMIQDLRDLGYASSKTVRKEIPYLMDRKLFLAWLLGFYDGDGGQDTTLIYSASKVFLEQIKNKLKLGWEVKEIKKRENYNNMYYLRLGAKIFNEMMSNYQDSMKRKRRKFREDSFEMLQERITKDEIQDLVNKYPKYKIEQKLNVSYRVLQRLIEEWNIKEAISRTQTLKELLEENPDISYEEARKRVPQLGYKLFLNVRGEWRKNF